MIKTLLALFFAAGTTSGVAAQIPQMQYADSGKTQLGANVPSSPPLINVTDPEPRPHRSDLNAQQAPHINDGPPPVSPTSNENNPPTRLPKFVDMAELERQPARLNENDGPVRPRPKMC